MERQTPIVPERKQGLENTNNNSGQAFFVDKNAALKNSFAEKTQSKTPTHPIAKVMGSIKYQVIISILTLYTLFADDFRNAAFGKNEDLAFDAVNIALMSIFTIEIIISCFVIDGYFLSFFFFLDIISTLSIIFDVGIFTDVIFSSNSNTKSVSQLAGQSKASRAATRAVRIVKLFRIVRVIKLYKSARKAAEIKDENKRKQVLKEKMMKKKKLKLNDSGVNSNNGLNMTHLNNDHDTQGPIHTKAEQKIFPEETNNEFSPTIVQQEEPAVEEQITDEQLEDFLKNESKIGKILSDLTVKKIIIVVLLIMFVVPLFNTDSYVDATTAWDYTTTDIHEFLLTDNVAVPTTIINQFINSTITNFLGQSVYIIQFSTPFNEIISYDDGTADSLRLGDLISSSENIDVDAIMALRPDLTLKSGLNATTANVITAILNQKYLNTVQAVFSICKTIFICCVLLLLLQMFSTDIDTYIVEPIQGMMDKLVSMAKDPESASKEELNMNTEFETTVISNAIIKIGALLSIVFGSAGAEIIGSNIIEEGDMNPMIEGRKKCAIFGFCDIRHFTEVTEVLQEEILIFVNKIGSLVHESVYRYGGSANKNIGEAFLLVWKIPDDKYSLENSTNAITWKDRKYLGVLADFAVLGFVKTLIKINKDPLVLDYKNDEKLSEKIKDFRVDMGFGLHIGWAIEGAIGSEYKIDASYLSPNVNMASRLEAATKQFGVEFLISEDLYEVLTMGMKRYFRNIDRVTVKGSEKPLKLYTVDLNLANITPPMNKLLKYPNIADMPDSESKRALNMDYLKEEEIDNYKADTFIKNKKELKEVMIGVLSEEFRKRFDLGVSCYLSGKWSDSRLHLSEALKYRNVDGPTKNLLNYMKKFNYVAPNTWKNYRPLTSK